MGGGEAVLSGMEGDEAAAARIRVVRCPKCDKFLPELPAYSVYVCGGCGATLQGTHFIYSSAARLFVYHGPTNRSA